MGSAGAAAAPSDTAGALQKGRASPPEPPKGPRHLPPARCPRGLEARRPPRSAHPGRRRRTPAPSPPRSPQDGAAPRTPPPRPSRVGGWERPRGAGEPLGQAPGPAASPARAGALPTAAVPLPPGEGADSPRPSAPQRGPSPAASSPRTRAPDPGGGAARAGEVRGGGGGGVAGAGKLPPPVDPSHCGAAQPRSPWAVPMQGAGGGGR